MNTSDTFYDQGTNNILVSHHPDLFDSPYTNKNEVYNIRPLRQ